LLINGSRNALLKSNSQVLYGTLRPKRAISQAYPLYGPLGVTRGLTGPLLRRQSVKNGAQVVADQFELTNDLGL
jgi:hypothetical protein